MEDFTALASYQRCIQRLRENWPQFLTRRKERLVQQERHGLASEKVAEDILQDLLTQVLDWSIEDLNNQLGYADLVLTRLGVKYLLLEVKRPGALAWNERAVEAALEQALRYAHDQKVRCVGVTDGLMLYVKDVVEGGTSGRVFVKLDTEEIPETLWWLSVHGIYRPQPDRVTPVFGGRPEDAPVTVTVPEVSTESLLHPKYKLPAKYFAYVGDTNNPATWKLPFRLADGSVDSKRLPKAIQSIITNYRGCKVSSIPEAAIPDVLVRLADAAVSIGKMPNQSPGTSPAYCQLAAVLEQLGRLGDVRT
jgi:hypothetical protein